MNTGNVNTAADERLPLIPNDYDLELGSIRNLSRYLSIEETCSSLERKLEERKVSVLHRGSNCVTKIASCCSISSLITGPGLTFVWVFLREEEDVNVPSVLKDIGMIVTIAGVCLLIPCLFLALGTVLKNKGDKRLRRLKDELRDKVMKIDYYDNPSAPLRGDDFCRAYKDLGSHQIHKLSFKQLCEIQRVSEKVFKRLFEKSLLSSEQKNPWEQLKAIKVVNGLSELPSLLENGDIKNFIESKPGFFEELIRVLPDGALNDNRVKKLLVEFTRFFLNNDDVDEGIISNQIALMRQGFNLKNSLLLLKGDDCVTLKSHSEESSVAVPVKLLTFYSPYFRAIFEGREDGEGPSRWEETDADEIIISDISKEGFDLFIDYLRGISPIITKENCMEALRMASYFQLSGLILRCEPSLTELMEDKPVKESFDLLDDFPQLSPAFVHHVDLKLKRSLKFDSILENQSEYTEAAEKVKCYRLKISGNHLKELLKKEINSWMGDIDNQSFDQFMYNAQMYEGLIGNLVDESLQEVFAEVVQKRLRKFDAELPVFIQGPHFIRALIRFFEDDRNYDLISQYFSNPAAQLNRLRLHDQSGLPD